MLFAMTPTEKDQMILADWMSGETQSLYDLIEAGRNDGRTHLTDITHRNYEATKRRGLITSETTPYDFIEKIREEVTELEETYGTDDSELADIALVCFAMAEHYGIDLIEEMRKKTEFNETRP